MAKKFKGSITLVTVEDGAQGAPGTSIYTYIRYAEDDKGTNMTEAPSSTTKYIGIITTTEVTAPSTGYTWSKYIGDNGQPGESSYLHIAYANSSDGSVDFSTTEANGKLYIGQRVDTTPQDSEVYSDYTWALFKGTDGTDGKDGNGITNTSIEYAVSDSGETEPETGWQSNIPTVEAGKYLWTKVTTYFTNGTNSVAYSVAKQGEDGKDGVADTYIINTNFDKVNKFLEEGGLSFSPENLTFSVYKTGLQQEETKILTIGDDYNYYLSLSDDLGNTIPDLKNFLSNYTTTDEDNLRDLVITESQIGVEDGSGEQKQRVNFSFFNLINASLSNSDDNINSLINKFYTNQALLLVIKVVDTKNQDLELSSKGIICEFGTSTEMAKFAITATKIQSAVNESKMEFSAEGLTIKNSGLKIEREYQDEDENKTEALLFFDEETGNLFIKGSGNFSGTINATNGSFNGKIIATEGSIDGKLTIGNIILDGRDYEYVKVKNPIEAEIDDYYILDENNNYIKSESFDENQTYFLQQLIEKRIYPSDENFYITNEGNAYFSNITLGTGAEIEDYIKLGNAYIYNPTKNEEKNFILVKDSDGNTLVNIKETGQIQLANKITISPEGKMNVGTLLFDGINSSITAQNGATLLWKISDMLAQFNDIQIGGSVFKPGTVTAAGGQFIFKDVITQEQIQEEIKERSETLFKDKYWYYGYNKETSASGENEFVQYIAGSTNLENLNFDYYLTLGKEEEGKFNDFLIGINGTKVTNLGAISLPSNSLSMSKLSKNENDIKTVEVLKIGNIDNNEIGLWSDNVRLEGFLTTHYEENDKDGYAGMGTGINNPAIFSNKLVSDDSKIVLWAGARGTTTDKIQAAPFQVTANGTLYAKNAIIENSTYVGGTFTANTIEAAELISPKIIGSGTNTGLIIENVDKGIIFTCGGTEIVGEEEVKHEVLHNFTLSKNGINTNLPFNSTAAIIGNSLIANKLIINDLTIENNKIITNGNLQINSNELEINSKTNVIGDFYLNNKIKFIQSTIADGSVVYDIYIVD